MSQFDLSAVTDAGRAAMQLALDNGYTMTFTSLVAGNGSYAAGEDLAGRTALKNQKNSYSFSSITKDADGATLKAAITNNIEGTSCVDTSYYVNEVGIYVTVNNVQYLYAVAAVAGKNGVELPAYDGDNAVSILQKWYVANSNDADIEIDGTGAYALAEDLATEAEYRAAADFNALYGLEEKVAVIGENALGNTVVTETNSVTGIVAVTTIVEDTVTESGQTYPRTTATTVITTDEYIYTKSDVIVERDETTETVSYTKEAIS